MKAIVLFYKTNSITSEGKVVELNHFRYFMNKQDLAQFLNKQPLEFTPVAIQKLNVSNTAIVDKNFKIVRDFMEGGK